MNKLKDFAHGALVPALLLILWEAAARAGLFSEVILPSPTAVAIKWLAYLMPGQPQEAGQGLFSWAFSGELLHDAYSSMYRVIGGFLIGAGLALPLGLMMGASQRVYSLFNPLMQILRPIPPIAYIPLAILWFGLGNPPSFFLIAIGAFFPVLMNTIAGVRQVDGIYLRAARNLGVNQWTMFTRVILPVYAAFFVAIVDRQCRTLLHQFAGISQDTGERGNLDDTEVSLGKSTDEHQTAGEVAHPFGKSLRTIHFLSFNWRMLPGLVSRLYRPNRLPDALRGRSAGAFRPLSPVQV